MDFSNIGYTMLNSLKLVNFTLKPLFSIIMLKFNTNNTRHVKWKKGLINIFNNNPHYKLIYFDLTIISK